MSERKLASIQIINNIAPIEGADAIEVATVNAWKLVVKKGEFFIGDKCIYCEIDSFMPERPEFEFLKPRGMRIKTIKLRGQVSQGICFPLHILIGLTDKDGQVINDEYLSSLQEETDVTEILGIIKYEPNIPACLAAKIKGNFPGFLRKTDEERIQNMSKYYENMKTFSYYETEKLNGSSCTIYLKNGDFGVCSRNYDLQPEEGNSFWNVVKDLNIENKLRELNLNISLQGELIGPGIQGNPYKLSNQTIFFFNVFDINNQEYYGYEDFNDLINKLDLRTVPIISVNAELPDTIDQLLLLAEGKSKLNSQVEREGLVIRSLDRKISFKVISNTFLLKEK